MANIDKLIERVLSGKNDNNLHFKDLVKVAKYYCITEDIEGSHHIYRYKGIREIINIQPVHSKAKPYQVKQVRNFIKKYFK